MTTENADDPIETLENLKTYFSECSTKSFDKMCDADRDTTESYHSGQKDAFQAAEEVVHFALEEIEVKTDGE